MAIDYNIYKRLGTFPPASQTNGEAIDESSGLIASRKTPGLFWTHNDSGSRFLFGLTYNPADPVGSIQYRKTLQLVGNGWTPTIGQWEDCAYDETRGAIWIANCGDNAGGTQFTAYRFTEPTTAGLGPSTSVLDVECERFTFEWDPATRPASGLDCEAMLCAPATARYPGRVYFVDKRAVTGDGGRTATMLWEAPISLAAYPAVNKLTAVKNWPQGVITCADWSPTGEYIVTTSNNNTASHTEDETRDCWTYDCDTFAYLGTIPLVVAKKKSTTANPQNEAICFTPDGSGLIRSSEGAEAEVWLNIVNSGSTDPELPPPDSGVAGGSQWDGTKETPLTSTYWDGLGEVSFFSAEVYGGDDPTDPTDPSVLPEVQPVWSDMVADIIGINCQYQFGSATYGQQPDACTQLVKDLKARHVRGRLVPGNAEQLKQFKALAQAGIYINSTISEIAELPLTDAAMDAYLAPVKANPGVWQTLTNVNEPQGTTNWQQKVRNHQQHLQARMAALGIPAITKTVAPALQDSLSTTDQDYIDMSNTDIQDFLDYGDYHRYPMGGSSNKTPTPSETQDKKIAQSYAAYGHTTFCTEGGFTTGVDAVGGQNAVPEDVQEAYAPRLYLELFNRGVRRVFIYELMDEPDPNNLSKSNFWGLVAVPGGALNDPAQWRKKPAFTAIASLGAELADKGGGYDPWTNPWTPPKIRLKITKPTTDVQTIVATKRDGSVRVYAWRDMPIWNKSTNTRITVPSVAMTVQTSTGTKTMQVGATVRSMLL